jgi:hypothetical protein
LQMMLFTLSLLCSNVVHSFTSSTPPTASNIYRVSSKHMKGIPHWSPLGSLIMEFFMWLLMTVLVCMLMVVYVAAKLSASNQTPSSRLSPHAQNSYASNQASCTTRPKARFQLPYPPWRCPARPKSSCRLPNAPRCETDLCIQMDPHFSLI